MQGCKNIRSQSLCIQRLHFECGFLSLDYKNTEVILFSASFWSLISYRLYFSLNLGLICRMQLYVTHATSYMLPVNLYDNESICIILLWYRKLSIVILRVCGPTTTHGLALHVLATIQTHLIKTGTRRTESPIHARDRVKFCLYGLTNLSVQLLWEVIWSL